jgi:competence protein ComEC
MLYHRKNAEVLSYLPGDQMVIRCIPFEITSRGNPYEFNYRFYMENQGIKYYSFTDSADILGYRIPERRNLIHRALIIRENIIDMFRQRGISGDRLALVAAITLGQKNMLDPEQKQYFMKAGVMHIMAVSGLHAVILSLFVFNILFFLQGRLNILRVIITILILWSFAFITGLTPSVLRATLMFTFLQAGKMMQRPVNGINSVLASAFVLILIKPSVIFDAGFLLSYSAVIYIICFYRDLYLKVSFKHRLPDLIWQSAAVTVIAQLGTLPLTIMLFNRFPVWFILSNVIIVPLSSLVVIMGCLVPLTFPLFILSKFLAVILSFLTGLTEQLTRIASALPFATIENIGITTTECIFLTLTIFLITHFLLKKESGSVILPISAILCLVLTGLLKDISQKNSCELIVYNAVEKPVIGIRTGRILNIYSDTIQGGQEVMRHYATLNLKKRNVVFGSNPLTIRAGKNNILITSIMNKDILQKMSPDYVIITGRKPVIERDILLSQCHIKALIFTSEVNENIRLPAGLTFMTADTVHIVRKNGAFSRRL